jgi:hypothetical protein
MSALANLQNALQAFVLKAEPGAEAAIVSTPILSASARLAIYSEAYRLRLIEALASNYPRLQQALGEQEFAAIALEYVETHRSRHPSIRWYGHEFASRVAARRADERWFSDLATWEWAVASAFDASDADPLDPAALSRIQPEQWSDLRLAFHPSIQRLALGSNAVALFKAYTENHLPPVPKLEEQTKWLIWRQELKTQYRSLAPAEAAVLDLMRLQGTFGDSCEVLCDWHEADEVPLLAASYLQRWLHDGLVCAVE